MGIQGAGLENQVKFRDGSGILVVMSGGEVVHAVQALGVCVCALIVMSIGVMAQEIAERSVDFSPKLEAGIVTRYEHRLRMSQGHRVQYAGEQKLKAWVLRDVVFEVLAEGEGDEPALVAMSFERLYMRVEAPSGDVFAFDSREPIGLQEEGERAEAMRQAAQTSVVLAVTERGEVAFVTGADEFARVFAELPKAAGLEFLFSEDAIREIAERVWGAALDGSMCRVGESWMRRERVAVGGRAPVGVTLRYEVKEVEDGAAVVQGVATFDTQELEPLIGGTEARVVSEAMDAVMVWGLESGRLDRFETSQARVISQGSEDLEILLTLTTEVVMQRRDEIELEAPLEGDEE